MSNMATPKPHVPSKKFEPTVFKDIELDPAGTKDELKKKTEKKPFELQPRLTARPFKGHPGLEDLKKHLGKKK